MLALTRPTVATLTSVCATAALPLGLAAAPAQAATQKQTRAIANCQKATVEPTSYILACADANAGINKATYTWWTRATAHGAGIYYVNNCTPSCVSGHFRTYKVKVKLSNPKTCTGQKHKVFSTIKLIYGKKHPGSASTQALSLSCPV